MVFMVIFMVPDPQSISSRRARKGARSVDKPQQQGLGPYSYLPSHCPVPSSNCSFFSPGVEDHLVSTGEKSDLVRLVRESKDLPVVSCHLREPSHPLSELLDAKLTLDTKSGHFPGHVG